jgi:hypothetical protein
MSSKKQRRPMTERAFLGERQKTEPPNSANLPWSADSQDEVARFSFSMRVNSYWLSALRDLAEEDDRSMQYIARNILYRELAKHIKRREEQAIALHPAAKQRRKTALQERTVERSESDEDAVNLDAM